MDLVREVEIEFGDAKLTCRGTVEFEGELQGADIDGVWERTKELVVHVVEDGEIVFNSEPDVIGFLSPGVYVVNRDGLYHRIDGAQTH